MTYDVLFSPEARDDLTGIYDYIADHASPGLASAYVARLEAFCLSLAVFSERGLRRDDIRPGLRLIGFERRVVVAVHLDGAAVIIDRLMYGGQDIDSRLR